MCTCGPSVHCKVVKIWFRTKAGGLIPCCVMYISFVSLWSLIMIYFNFPTITFWPYTFFYDFFWWVGLSERIYRLWSTSTEESLFLGWKRWWPTYNRTKRQRAEGFQWHPPQIWFNAAICALVGPVSTVRSSKSGLAQKQGELVPCCAMFMSFFTLWSLFMIYFLIIIFWQSFRLLLFWWVGMSERMCLLRSTSTEESLFLIERDDDPCDTAKPSNKSWRVSVIPSHNCGCICTLWS